MLAAEQMMFDEVFPEAPAPAETIGPRLEPPKHWSFKAVRKDVDLARILREAEEDAKQRGEKARGVVIDLPGFVLIGVKPQEFEIEWQSQIRSGYSHGAHFWDSGWLFIAINGGNANAEAMQLRADLATYDAAMAKKHRVTVQVF